METLLAFGTVAGISGVASLVQSGYGFGASGSAWLIAAVIGLSLVVSLIAWRATRGEGD